MTDIINDIEENIEEGVGAVEEILENLEKVAEAESVDEEKKKKTD